MSLSPWHVIFRNSHKQSSRTRMAMAPFLQVSLITGGETTASLSSTSGKDVQNQELALSAALQTESIGMRNVTLASAATDGTDGPTDAAGDIVDGPTMSGVLSTAQDALRRHNSYLYFEASSSSRSDGPLIKTGPTGTNFADVCVVLVHGISKRRYVADKISLLPVVFLSEFTISSIGTHADQFLCVLIGLSFFLPKF